MHALLSNNDKWMIYWTVFTNNFTIFKHRVNRGFKYCIYIFINLATVYYILTEGIWRCEEEGQSRSLRIYPVAISESEQKVGDYSL